MKERLYYLDDLRVFLTMLVIVHHTSIAYGAGGSWYFEDVDKSEITVSIVLLTMFTAINQSFFMGLFFLLSGYFTPSSYDRKGPAKFLTDRFVRLGIPLAAFQFLLGPVVTYISGRTGYDSFQSFYRAKVLSFDQTFFGPLWFVETLLYFAVAYALWRMLTRSGNPDGHARQRQTFRIPNNRTLFAAAVILGLAAFAVRLVFPTGTDVLGLQLGYFPMYIVLFIAGAAAGRTGLLSRIPPERTRRWFRVSLAAIPVLPVALILTGALDAPPAPLQKALSDSAYTAYIIHPLVIVPLSLVLVGVSLHPNLKFGIVGSAGAVLCFAAAWLIRRIPGAKRIL